jgi:adenosylmethionine-8-amino-7-oxononanoate aminotransferase
VRDTMVLSPALVATREDIDVILERVKAAIDATARDLKRL